MSELQVIETTLRQAGGRRRWQRAWRGLWQGLLLGGVVWLVVLGVYKLLPLPPMILPVAGGVGLGLALIGFLAGWWRKDRLLETARWVDQNQQLKERLSTALEISQNPKAGQWRDLLVKDAVGHLSGLDFRKMLPYHLPKASRWALLVLALAAGIGFAPEYRTQAHRQKQKDKDNIREAGRQLADLTRRTLEHRKPALEATQEAIKSVGELGTQLSKNPLSRSEALRELGKLADKIQQQSKELAKNPALKSMVKSSSSTAKNSPTTAEELKKQIEDLQKSLGNKDATTDALNKLRDELQKAQQAAAGLMGKNSKAADAARESLAKALSSLAKQSEELGAALPSIEEAIAALEAGKIDQVMKDLEVAERDLEKLSQMAQALQQMRQQATQQGKTLAEQLKNGEAEAARATLKKMESELKSGTLSPERMKAMMEELSKAISPAAPYGKVADLLKQGLRQLEQGEKPQAAQSLADAAKELENLMQEMADAQDLKGTLAALKKAQMCVGNGTGWCKSDGPPRVGKGGKPSRGVGTWADEDGSSEAPEQSERWDNSDVDRPDTDARGLTDRGPGDPPEGLTPTKVKGQLSPGGQMPSITLKGVSIKGQSTVAIQEAITAAQSEAQSALSHDQVPKAYQGAVKDYFNDLKK